MNDPKSLGPSGVQGLFGAWGVGFRVYLGLGV